MTLPFSPRRVAAACLAVVLSAALAACFVLPGKFAATLDLRKDGQFTYSYKGEIFILGLSKLSSLSGQNNAPFEPAACYNEETGEDRPCNAEETAKQKADWEQDQQANAERQKKENENMKAMLGGIDPSDPKAGEELAARLRRQAGWNSVIYKGDGRYEVDFSASGRLDHDFSFPTLERMPVLIPFFVINRRADGSVRVDTPVMDGNGGGNMGELAQMGAAAKGGGDNGAAGLPKVDGTFVLTTDGKILANNTDEGPKADPTGQRLEWKINPANTAAPMALIRLGK